MQTVAVFEEYSKDDRIESASLRSVNTMRGLAWVSIYAQRSLGTLESRGKLLILKINNRLFLLITDCKGGAA